MSENRASEVTMRKGRQGLPKCIGAYVDAKIQGLPLYFTADTGSSKTIVSKKIYEKIPINKRPTLAHSEHSMTCAGGTILKEHGKAIFDLQLGPLKLSKEVIIADI